MSSITEYIKIRRPIVVGIDQWIITNRTGSRAFYYDQDLQLPMKVLALMNGHMTRYFMADYDLETKQYTIIKPSREQDW
jgi:hypothetical protein